MSVNQAPATTQSLNVIPENSRIAAVDLGSNSFHMILARVVNQELQVVDRLKETVRLASGLDRDGYLDEEVQERALACLRRFGEALSGVPGKNIRAVGTNTLRAARNGREFLTRIRDLLQIPVEVISGYEEARLIYLGVAHTLANGGQRRLVCDIGGGSTECILGTGFEPEEATSRRMGCVTWSQRFFPGGHISPITMTRAELSALQELEETASKFQGIGWQDAIGASGTINAVGTISEALGLGPAHVITEPNLRHIRNLMIECGEIDKLDLPGLKPDRQPSIAGGVAILTAIFQAFQLKEMQISSGALREGLLYDLIGRIGHKDRRETTIEVMCDKYQIDRKHAARVQKLSRHFFDCVQKSWSLDSKAGRQILGWAAKLHEVGHAISYSGYHKHGEYLLRHSQMPGFSKDDQELLAVLVRTHRRKLNPELFRDLPSRRKFAKRLAFLLRLAVLLNRRRADLEDPGQIKLKAKGQRLTLIFPDNWLESQALIKADLETEAISFAKMGVELRFR